jgi:hypothetical protein
MVAGGQSLPMLVLVVKVDIIATPLEVCLGLAICVARVPMRDPSESKAHDDPQEWLLSWGWHWLFRSRALDLWLSGDQWNDPHMCRRPLLPKWDGFFDQ